MRTSMHDNLSRDMVLSQRSTTTVHNKSEEERAGNASYTDYRQAYERMANQRGVSPAEIIAEAYDFGFDELLDELVGTDAENRIAHALAERKNATGQAYALDLMSTGLYLRALQALSPVDQTLLDAGISVTLGDGRWPEERSYDDQHNLRVLEEDISKSSAWAAIRTAMRDQAIPGFDVITCLAKAGFHADTFPTHEGWMFNLLNKAWGMLNDNGILLTQIPASIPN